MTTTTSSNNNSRAAAATDWRGVSNSVGRIGAPRVLLAKLCEVARCSDQVARLERTAIRWEGPWGATNGPQKDWMRSGGMMDLDNRNSMPNEYRASLVDQVPAPIADPYRVPELTPLNPSNEASLDRMEAEHSSSSIYDKYGGLSTRNFDNRLGKSGSHYDQLKSMKGPSKPPMMQPVYKHTMDVLHENVSGTPQMNSQLSAQLSSQMPSSMGLSSSMGLLGQQGTTLAGQQVTLGSIAQSMAGDFSGGFPASSGTVGGPTSSRLAHKNGNNSLLRQSSSPAGLLAQLSIDVQAMTQGAKNEKQSLSSPNAHSPAESLSGGTSEENGGAGPTTPGMMSRIDVGGWEDAQSYMNSWDTNFAARKRFRDMDIDPLVADSFLQDPLRSSQEHNPAPLTRHMSLPAQTSKSSMLTDDILQSVPCRIRAKRGCATHPRSIAERVRRTRISERMRKLQELVPNMDKQQTNTADMLDEAVEYVKQLQRQVQFLKRHGPVKASSLKFPTLYRRKKVVSSSFQVRTPLVQQRTLGDETVEQQLPRYIQRTVPSDREQCRQLFSSPVSHAVLLLRE
ncbi:hypothetical protein R1flu_020713 [Riccia fluitans]|uniref:BHLH domain-containing protein n=1 Tax=Riccia fluitans TaxID=41844 RepID=A0ABD1ZMM8_9MARC